MNKIAEQFQNDVVVRYQQKMAELVKRAEDEQIPDLIPQTQEERSAKPSLDWLSSNANAYRAAKDVLHEISTRAELLSPDKLFPSKSVITGTPTGIPGRASETALQAAGGVKLPVPSDSYTHSLPFNVDSGPYMQQLNLFRRFGGPIGRNFANEISDRIYGIYADNEQPRALTNPYTGEELTTEGFEKDINGLLRKEYLVNRGLLK